MDIQLIKTILPEKEPAALYELVQPALEGSEVRDLLVEGCFARDETYRYNCVRVLFRAIEAHPGLFYPYWERFAGRIRDPNGFYRSTAAQALAHLASVDDDRRLDAILDAHLRMLDDEKIMVARYFTQTIHLVAEARPDLRERIVDCLLGVEATRHNESRLSLLKTDVLGAFDALFDALPVQQRKEILAFAAKALDSESPSTRKAARAFLEKHR
jgi:hypothetical protein